VRLHHFRRKLTVAAFAGLGWMATVVVVLMVLRPVLPRGFEFAGILSVVLPLGLRRGLYDAFVTRTHEAEADAFAVDIAGGRPLVEALAVLGCPTVSAALLHNRWTTHSTWERRVRRIEEREQSRHVR
jgi:Zn-dependent protease with chaperone function